MLNLYKYERAIRLVMALVVLWYASFPLTLMGIFGLVLLATALVGFCPIYYVLRINQLFASKSDFLSNLPKHNPEPVFVFCAKGNSVFANVAAKKILPTIDHFSHISSLDAVKVIEEEERVNTTITSGEQTYLLEAIGIKEEGFILAYGANVSAIEQSRKMLKQQLITDKLTGLGNRKRLFECVSQTQCQSAVLVVFDVVGFGQINTFFGHEKGDQFLALFAKDLKAFGASYAEVDSVYRLGGNTFGLFLVEHDSPSHPNSTKKAFLEAFTAHKMELGEIQVSFSIRAGSATSQGDTPGLTLLNQAETALSEAKKSALPVLEFEQMGDINSRYQNNIYWATTLHDIVKQATSAKFRTYFQPIYNFHTGRIEKYESLIRIEDKGEVISPFAFLKVAEQTHLLPKITAHVLGEALATFVDTSYEFSLNISAQDLRQDTFLPMLLAQTNAKGVSPERIVLEILEDDEMYGFSPLIGRLKEAGFKIAIDDFGTGYSNFKKLQSIHVDYVKIDGSLIKNIATCSKDLSIVASICTYAKAIGAKTIGEFVADEAIFEALKKTGVDYAQGYYLGMPNPEIKDAL
ncbi:MAG: EAL domain-containing protein [Campylobacterales bacterium]|nr:EAL domain-containing protein [Campylobacterales bacterium]